ncbi:MAG: ATP-binding protein [Anaerolineales bacterium]|nr:ATP-binding protein [Anaerolineales bacterium]
MLGGDVLGRREADHRKHSPFALALFDALEKGEADLIPKGKGDGVITATELYLFLREQVEVQAEVQANHEQTPGLWPLNKHRKGEFIFLAPGHPLNLPPAPDLTADANPYRGLKSYDQKHSQIFFGREDEITRLVDLVDQLPFVAVLGASGTGKSSLVKAGVLPRLQTARSPEAARCGGDVGYQSYHVLPPMRPGDQPVQSLAALLRVEPGEDAVSLAHGADALSQFVARWAVVHPGQRLVLTIDQFEEMVTLCRDDEHQYFLRLLAAAIQGQPDVFRLIITLRGDFEPLFADTTLFKDDKASDKAPKPQSANDGINSSFSYVVPPMSHDDLRQVIERPASAQVLYFDPPDLVDKLIDEVIQTPGALPLLSFTLSELYVKYVQSDRDDRSLTGADYGALGGVVGSLRHRATEEYGRLPDEAHRTAMQRAMLRMVSVEGSELARRRVSERELDYLENDLSKTVIDRLVDARLLVHDRDNLNGDGNPDPYVEPAHDALVLAWDNLLAWKKEAEEYLPLQRRLWQSAREWQDAPPDAKSGLLWDDDPRLPQVEETLWPTKGKQSGLAGRIRWGKQVLFPDTTAPSDTRWLNEAEFSFVQASVRERAKYWQRTVYIASAVIVVLFGLTVFANVQRQVANVQRDNAVKAEQTAEARRVEAERNAAVAQARELAVRSQTALDSDVSLALLMAVEAMTITQPYLSISEPVSATDTAPFARNVVEPEPTQRLHVAAADQALIDALARPVGRPMKGQAPDLYLSEDGKRLFGVNVYSHDLKTQLMKVYEWDMERPTDSYQEWPALSVGSLQELAFRPDGTMVLLDGYLGSASPVQTNCLSPDHSALEHYLEIRTKSKPFGGPIGGKSKWSVVLRNTAH